MSCNKSELICLVTFNITPHYPPDSGGLRGVKRVPDTTEKQCDRVELTPMNGISDFRSSFSCEKKQENEL